MSRRNDFAALQEIRRWDVDTVVLALEKNGLCECATAVRKRGINGDTLLDLTEMKLAVWKRDLTLVNVRKLSMFVQDLNKNPGRYLLTDNELSQIITNVPSQVKKEIVNPASLKGLLPVRSGSSSSHSSWGSDFDDDFEDGHTGKHESGNKKESEWHSDSTKGHSEKTSTIDMRKEFGSQNGSIGKTVTRVPAKLTIPNAFTTKPVVTASKPKVPVKFPSPMKTTNRQPLNRLQPEENPVESNNQNTISHTGPPILPQHPKPMILQGKPNLPKPPASIQGTGTVEKVISNLVFEEEMCDEEYYDSYDSETCPDIKMLQTSMLMKSHDNNLGNELTPVDPSNSYPNETDKSYNGESCSDTKLSQNSSPSHIKSHVLNVGTKLCFPSTAASSHCPQNQNDNQDGKTYPDVKFSPSPSPSSIKSHILNLGTKLSFPPMGAPKSAASHRSPSPNSGIPSQLSQTSNALPMQNNDEISSQQTSARIPSPKPVDTTNQPPKILYPKPTNIIKETVTRQPESTLLQEFYQEEEYVVGSNSENGYESEEYEYIQDHQVPESQNYYLQPTTEQKKTASSPLPIVIQEPQTIAPPLPAKIRPLPDLITPPVSRSASPSKTKSEDSGSSGDGVTGRLEELFRKRREVKEKTPAPETKKTATPPVPNHKPPPPPPVEQRSPPVCRTQRRPLPQPPVADPNQNNASGSTRRTETHQFTNMPWYHNVDRRKGETMLRNSEDGAFMIRPSTLATNPLTLTLWYNGRFYHISVRHRPDGRYALGTEKANEQSFPTLEELVVSYHSEKLVLYSGGAQAGTTLLTSTPRKETSK